jgi:hypothetical protein
VTVINGDAPVIGKVTHPYVSVHGTVGHDLVHGFLRCVIVPLRVGVLQEVKAAARVVLRLRLPQRSRHTAEIGKEPTVLVIYVEGGNTVGLGNTRRQVVVGTAELDGGDLLQGEDTSVLIEIEHRELHALSVLDGHGETNLAVHGIAVIDNGLLVLTLEILADLQ